MNWVPQTNCPLCLLMKRQGATQLPRTEEGKTAPAPPCALAVRIPARESRSFPFLGSGETSGGPWNHQQEKGAACTSKIKKNCTVSNEVVCCDLMGLKQAENFQAGYLLSSFDLDESIRHWVENKNWLALDQAFANLTAPGGALFNFLQRFHDFQSIEFIISIRDGENPDEEDGIWHDDGSRAFSFSLSLTLEEIEGGKLGVRKVGANLYPQIPTPPYGGIILFLTGVYGFEHKIHQVTRGKRVIIAGWCT